MPRIKNEPTVGGGVELANLLPGHDAAKVTQADDHLERWPVAESMYRAIKATPLGFSTRIGLYGEWGAGKSSVLNFLHLIAMGNEDLVIHVSAWRAVDADSFISTLSEKMSAEVKRLRLKPNWLTALKGKFARISGGVAAFSEATGQVVGKLDSDAATAMSMGAAFTATVAQTMMERLKLSRSELIDMQKVLAERGARVIVFIDDLDRADPAILPRTLMTLRDYLDWPEFAFVLAFDKEIITRALEEYSSAFTSTRQPFLDKIVDLAFELKPPPPHLSASLAERAMAECCDFIPIEARVDSATWFPDNPRTSRSIARELGNLREVALRHGQTELSWEAIILQTLLRREASACADVVEEHLLGKDAPWLPMMFERERKKELAAVLDRVVDTSGYTPVSSAFKRLYALIVKLQGLRARHSPEKICYEMQLFTQSPCFTKRELSALVAQWARSNDAVILTDALKSAAYRGAKSSFIAASNLLDMTLDMYVANVDELKGIKSATPRMDVLAKTQDVASFLTMLLELEPGQALGSASARLGFSVRILDVFVRFSERTDPDADERPLRLQETKILEAVVRRCEKQADLYHSCARFGSDDRLSRLVKTVKALTADAAVEDILAVLTKVNGVHLCSDDDASKPKLHLFCDEKSVLFSEQYKDKFLQVFVHSRSADERSILAKNSLDCLKILLDQMGGVRRFWAAHPDVIKTLWSAVTAEEWLYSGREQVSYIHKGLSYFAPDSGIIDPYAADDA